MPDLSPGIFSAHDRAEGEFFSAADENNGHAGETAQARQDRGACLHDAAARRDIDHPHDETVAIGNR